jgi:hypothetical protein
MKSSLSLVLTTLALPTALLVGCGGGGGGKGDMAVKVVPDMVSTTPTCISADGWTPLNGAIFTLGDSTHYDDSELQALNPAMNAEGNSDFLILDALQVGTAEPVPSTGTFSTAPASKDPGTAPFGPAADMALMAGTIIANCDPPSCSNSDVEFFYATAGTMTITKATDGPVGGMAASLSNVTFSQYTSGQTPSLIVGGKCYSVSSLSLSGNYSAGPDGGADM